MEEDEFRKRLSDMSNYNPFKYETYKSSFMPHIERLVVEHPDNYHRVMEEAELAEEYDRIYEENGIPRSETDDRDTR